MSISEKTFKPVADMVQPEAGQSIIGTSLPFIAVAILAIAVPFSGNDYWISIASRAAIYWVLISGLNFVVGYAGQMAIGYVSLLALGAYTTSVLAGGSVLPAYPLPVAFAGATLVGAVFGVLVGLPALRLKTFYFAMTTLGFATIVTQIALAWQDVTGGGIGIPGPLMPAPFDSVTGFYILCLALAVLCTIGACNIGRSHFGRALIAVRDAEVAAEASGIRKIPLFVTIFILAGATAGLAGGLFATLQTYITPEAFSFDLSVMFFIAVLIGGRGSVTGPLIGTIVLTILPEIAAPLAAWSTTLYAGLLLVIVLAIPGGIAALMDSRSWKALPSARQIVTKPAVVKEILDQTTGARKALKLNGIELSFGGLKAIQHLDLQVEPGKVHGLIGPNGSGKTTTLNVISGYYKAQAGHMQIGDVELPGGSTLDRASLGISRTYQTPRYVGEASVIENVMVGAASHSKSTFLEALLCLPRSRRDEREMRRLATLALRTVGIESLAEVRADRLQHSELRFMEIARALMSRPGFILLDEPAAGLSVEEIKRLGALVKAISRDGGVGVLLVEHHADLIFEICDEVTVLNLGKILAQGTPSQIRSNKEVVSAYLGA